MPVYNPVLPNPDGMWQIWNMRDVYTGPNGTGRFVVKVQDEVHEIQGNEIRRYIVTAVGADNVPTLQAVREVTFDQDIQPSDVLFGNTASTYRMFVDRSVSPARIQVDRRLMVGSSAAAYCKIFKGTNVNNDGVVISSWLNNAGDYVSENIPMELVATDRYTNNTGIKTVMAGWTSANLLDGDTVTAVIYDAEGIVIEIKRLLVQNTGFIRSVDAFSKAVIGISLKSPFLAAANSGIINYPVNLPLNALNLTGVVHYSNGETLEMSVDGTRFSAEGLEAFAPTGVGQTAELTLKYRLQAGESAFGNLNYAEDQFSETYTVQTVAVEGRYSVQLYCYPVWVSAVAGYRLAWFLYDLERSINYEVTPLVTIDPSTRSYSPVSYGEKQTLSVYINLKNVNAVYRDYTHVQYVDVILNHPGTRRPPTGGQSNWLVTQAAGSVPQYGKGSFMSFYQQSPSSRQVKVKGEFETQEQWLEGIYYRSRPLFNPSTETRAPEPTHFNLVVSGVKTTLSITQWDKIITLTQAINNNDTAYLEFFKRTPDADLQLSKVGLPIFQVDAVGGYL